MARASALLLMAVLLPSDVLGEGEWMSAFAKHSERDNPIPISLVKKFEDDFKKATADPKMEHSKPLVRHLMIVRSEFTESKSRALKGQVRVLTPPGGGTVDMSEFVTPLRGSFNLKIRFENDHHEVQPTSRVYFVSQSKERVIDGDKVGSGCGRFYDVTTYFRKEMAKGGFQLYTADQRYVSVLRGTFVFASYTPEALQLASLTFFDSRYKKWDCPGAEVL